MNTAENNGPWEILSQVLKEERARIDALDEEIVRLLNERVGWALKVGAKKEELGLPLHDPARERLIFERLKQKNASHGGELSNIAITAIYREIISACRNAEGATRVAFLGPAGTNTQEAAVQYFGSTFSPVPCVTPDEICAQVVRGSTAGGADYGVIAIENSIEGVVMSNLDLLADTELTICAEIELLIHLCLLSNEPLDRIEKIYSHPHALAQCRAWLRSHVPSAALVPVSSTARGAEMAAQEPGTAAIGSALAGNIYNLGLGAADIEDLAGNKTRFFVVGPTTAAPAPSGQDKTSLAFQVPHKPGALVDVLGVFTARGINLSMIQSRPSRQRAWEYRFFADLQAHIRDENLRAALEDLKEHTVSVKILGSYPEAQ
ncbi:MAG TPA: prephenate dehydratase [Abditibacteriaceae bacterium]|jgi:chorismate mutase/prephenate dehydratase